MQLSFLDQWLDARTDARINLGESGMANIALEDIVPDSALAGIGFDHNDTLGSLELRREVCKLHDGVMPEQVLITAGITEALLVYLMTRRRPGANVVVTVPAFHNLIDLPAVLGLDVRQVPLSPDDQYALPVRAIREASDDKTMAVLLTTPGNPMGNVFSPVALLVLARQLDGTGCDIVLDEQYRLLPHTGDAAALPSLAGTGCFVGLGSPGKCYGAVGLRVGWVISSPEQVAAMQAMKTLTTHAISKLQDTLCLHLLKRGDRLLQHNRTLVRRNAARLAELIGRLPGHLAWIAPEAGSMAFPQLCGGKGSMEFGEALYQRHGVLVLPGEAFGRPGFFRIRLGVPEEDFETALVAIAEVLEPA